MKLFFITICCFALMYSACLAEDQKTLTTQKDKESYSLGYEFGANIRRDDMEVNIDVLLSAVREGVEGKKPLIDEPAIRNNLSALKKKMMVIGQLKLAELSSKNLKEGKAFMETNKTKDGVNSLPDGLQYKIIRESNGPHPKTTDMVKLNYRGTFIDGTEFDSSHGFEEPSHMRVDSVIKGWTEALTLMKVGAKWQLFVPSELAYGQRRFGRIPPNSVLVFDMELLGIDEAPKELSPKSSETPDIKTPGYITDTVKKFNE